MTVRICPNCGAEFTLGAQQGRKQFCDSKGRGVCQREFWQTHKSRMMVLGPVAIAWRRAKNATSPADKALASYAFTQLCRGLDEMIAQDKRDGRRSEIDVKARMDMGWQYGDGRGWTAR